MSPRMSSVVAVVCRDFCTPSFIGSVFQSESSTSSVYFSYRCQQNQRQATARQSSSVTFRQRLHSASSHQLVVPCYRLSTYGRRAFSVAVRCPGTCCRTTYETLKSAPSLSDNIRIRSYFHCTSTFRALEVVQSINQSINNF